MPLFSPTFEINGITALLFRGTQQEALLGSSRVLFELTVSQQGHRGKSGSSCWEDYQGTIHVGNPCAWRWFDLERYCGAETGEKRVPSCGIRTSNSMLKAKVVKAADFAPSNPALPISRAVSNATHVKRQPSWIISAHSMTTTIALLLTTLPLLILSCHPGKPTSWRTRGVRTRVLTPRLPYTAEGNFSNWF